MIEIKLQSRANVPNVDKVCEVIKWPVISPEPGVVRYQMTFHLDISTPKITVGLIIRSVLVSLTVT